MSRCLSNWVITTCDHIIRCNGYQKLKLLFVLLYKTVQFNTIQSYAIQCNRIIQCCLWNIPLKKAFTLTNIFLLSCLPPLDITPTNDPSDTSDPHGSNRLVYLTSSHLPGGRVIENWGGPQFSITTFNPNLFLSSKFNTTCFWWKVIISRTAHFKENSLNRQISVFIIVFYF